MRNDEYRVDGVLDAQDEILKALAGAVLLRTHLTETGDEHGIHLALLTVDALLLVCESLGLEPKGTPVLESVDGSLPQLGLRDVPDS